MHAKAVTAGFLSGLVVGAVVWSTQIRRSRRELFSRNPVRRLAALGYLSGQPGLDTARILTEYVRWERDPALRKRGERLLRRVHAHFD
ncbi:MAG TPA: hypothetical protein VL524_02890 [Gemmatimonadaceae bacterium]|jgi:hypothetical protein|nr:hypothetical protein [Gemmatimonadaceae bacterium]